MVAQLDRVRLQHAVLQIPGPEVEQDVDNIQQITQVVQAEPHHDRVTCGVICVRLG